jgi:predicted transcriptional regulator
MAIAQVDTLAWVAGKTKRVPQAVLDSFARALALWVRESCDGNQTRAAKLLGVSQGHISAMILGTRGPGLNAILALRDRTGISTDELLGLGPPATEALTERLRASFDMEVARFRSEANRTLEEARVTAAKAQPVRGVQPKRRKGSA